MEAKTHGSAEHVAELELELTWSSAINDWRAGIPGPIAELVGAAGPMPDFARRFVVDVLLDDISGETGRPHERRWQDEESILRAYEAEYASVIQFKRTAPAEFRRRYPRADFPDDSTPRGIAHALVARARNSTYGAIKGVVDRRRKKRGRKSAKRSAKAGTKGA